MRVRTLTAVVLAAGLTAVVGCKSKDQIEADNAALKAEKDKLQGKWKVASREGVDEDSDEDAAPPLYVVVIKDNVMEHTFGNEVGYRQKMDLTPTASPKQVDLTYVNAEGKPETRKQSGKSLTGKKKTKTVVDKYPAIYSLDGDKLKIAVGYDGKRPTDFTAPPGSSRYVLTLQKLKDGEKEPAAAVEEPKPTGKSSAPPVEPKPAPPVKATGKSSAEDTTPDIKPPVKPSAPDVAPSGKPSTKK